MREVYHMVCLVVTEVGGSSPLARGLRQVRHLGGVHARISPARAGFTRSDTPLSRTTWDHPRSRGVYGNDYGYATITRGSSPLARGLRTFSADRASAAGIIPARAGFTLWPAGWSIRWRDHPRSRGVYLVLLGGLVRWRGSSPLARGLRYLAGALSGEDGIIPARAGFTPPAQHAGARWRDHPRSRGVYDRGAGAQYQGVGSSPLARGLRGDDVDEDGAARIIPARAGFTQGGLAVGDLAGDHPRSRGVYGFSSPRTTLTRGSSPLARGLPEACSWEPVADWDHPRSRGVYHTCFRARACTAGSSPLARGLPQPGARKREN